MELLKFYLVIVISATKPHPSVGASYTSMPNKFCPGRNELFESKLGVFKSADECKKKCTDDPKCVSAEWFGDDPTQCDTSSSCTSDRVVDAPRDYDMVIFVEQAALRCLINFALVEMSCSSPSWECLEVPTSV